MDRRQKQGVALKAWRQRVGISQRAAAALIAQFTEDGRPVAQPTWSAWERGEDTPSPFFLFALERMTRGDVKAKGWTMRRNVRSALSARAA